MIVIALSLVLAHLLADFVLQRRAVVLGKLSRRWQAHLEHAALQLLAAEACLAAFSSLELVTWATQGLLLAYVLLHVVLDVLKAEAGRSAQGRGRWQVFVVDQAGHIGIALVLAWVLADAPQVLPLAARLWEPWSFQLLLGAVVYVWTVCGVGYLNGTILSRWARRLEAETDGNESGLEDAGLYIGWLERFLVLTAVVVGSPETAGLVVAAKSVFRFEDMKKGRAFAEYFLLGTFLSVSEALAAGLLLRTALGIH